MFLFVTITVICLLIALSSDIAKLLPISQVLRLIYGDEEVASLQTQLKTAREELTRVSRAPDSSGEFTQFVKTMRAERKVKDVEQEIRDKRNAQRFRDGTVVLITNYAVKALLSLVLLVISVRNRYTPVMIFTDRLDFRPLGGLLSFPTGVTNAISVPMWVLSCNVSFRLLLNLVRRKNTAGGLGFLQNR